VITLARKPFAGPFMLPLWAAPKSAGVYAVMVPGWRPLTFRALHFAQAEALGADSVKAHPRYAEWLSIAGTEWNLYLAVHEMSFSSAAQRQATVRELERGYRPEFQDFDQDAPSLRTLMLAQALRENRD
jgi:hypothetical protein